MTLKSCWKRQQLGRDKMPGSSRLRGWLIAQTAAIVLSTAGAIAAARCDCEDFRQICGSIRAVDRRETEINPRVVIPSGARISPIDGQRLAIGAIIYITEDQFIENRLHNPEMVGTDRRDVRRRCSARPAVAPYQCIIFQADRSPAISLLSARRSTCRSYPG